MLKGLPKENGISTPLVGWKEWISLNDLSVPRIKVKIDTGAWSSSLHAFDVEEFQRGGVDWVRFSIHPLQHARDRIETEAPLVEYRQVRSSSGHISRRPVIITRATLGSFVWPIELTLSSRDEMGFRMLLGRQAIRNRFLVHSGASFLLTEE